MNIEMFSQFRDSLVGSWGSLTASARVQLILTGLVTAALVIFVVAWGASPDYVNLYSGLSAQDSALVRAKLDEMGVPFRIEGNGTIIQVPRNKVGVSRLDLAAEGIPSSHTGVGFDIFDDMDFMTSKQVIDVQYERAVMGTLQSMLNEFDFIKSSKVFIKRSEPGLFSSSQEPSKAAVTLDVTRKLNSKEVEALLGIITSFGPANLTRETVTLATLEGVSLNVAGNDEFGGLTDGMLEANRVFEREYKKKAEANLRAIGVASVVSVSIVRDFSQQSKYVEEFEKGKPVSTETTSTSVETTDGAPQGPTGATANLPDGDAVVGGSRQTTEETKMKLENLELPTTITSTEFAVGRIKSVSASAFVEGKRVEKLDDDDNPTGEFTYEKYSDEEVESFRVTIATSIGFGMTKDDVEVTALDRPINSLAYAAGAGVVSAPDSGMWGKITSVTGPIYFREILWWVLRIALLAAALFLLRRMFRSMVREEIPEEEEAPLVSALDNALSAEDARKQEIAEEVSKISQQEPEAVAALLRTWLTEDEA